VADHNANVRGNDLVPITKFHIPGLLIGPNVTPQEFSLMSSQVDLLPTILHFTGLETTHPMVGRNLMNLPSGTPGRAIMQFADNNAYQVADQVLIQRPFLPPLQFRVNGSVLEPVELNPEMAKDALAFAHLPWLVYSQRLYRLP
jgi:phosphoglycerol transferase MdoB-like AlkP superfamily enzyme